MQKKPERERVWKGCISLPPECYAFLKTRPGTRSAIIAAAVTQSAAYKKWLKGQRR